MKKISIALALLLIMTVHQVNAVVDQTPSKSKCQELFESCKEASNNLTVKMSKESALCRECMEKCNSEALMICANAEPKEKAKYMESFNGHSLNCKQICQ